MTTELTSTGQKAEKQKVYRGGGSEAVYGLGLIGAWVYYISTATTFWMGLLGIFKGIFWPAVLVYEFLKFLQL
jgi:hypothetical protein